MKPALDARSIARLMGGTATSPKHANVPGPGHSRIDRSLSITINPRAPDGFLVKSHAGDDDLQCKDHVKRALGLEAWRPSSVVPMRAPEPRPVELKPNKEALRLWTECVHPRSTLVEKYLRARGLDLPDEVAGDVCRFHPRLYLDGDYVPGMVTLLRHLVTDEPWMIQRTFLTPDGGKICRKYTGSPRMAAIKLDACEHVHEGLVIGEGFESCLGARFLGFKPVWAVGSSGQIASFPVLSGIEALTVLGENDSNGANERAALECMERWEAAGWEFHWPLPAVGRDFNDAWVAAQEARP
jgi:hypothetical protein